MFSETPVNFQRSTWRYMPDDRVYHPYLAYVCLSGCNSCTTAGRIFMKFEIVELLITLNSIFPTWLKQDFSQIDVSDREVL